MDTPPPRCWAEVDLRALRHNNDICQDLVGANSALMAVVKADAYGHGLAQVVTALADRVAFFGVANCREARRTRVAAGSEVAGILILGPGAPAEIEAIVAGGFSAVVSTIEEVEAGRRTEDSCSPPRHVCSIRTAIPISPGSRSSASTRSSKRRTCPRGATSISRTAPASSATAPVWPSPPSPGPVSPSTGCLPSPGRWGSARP